MTFSPVLHRVSQPGWWLMRWTAFDVAKSYIFKTDTTRMRQMIVIAFFQQLVALYYSSAFMQLHGPLFLFLLYRKRNIDLLVTQARFKRRTLHVPNLMQMRKIYCFRWFALDSAHIKFDVWNGPHFAQKRNLFVKKCKGLKLPAVRWLSGPGWPGKRDYMEKFQPG